MSALQPHQQRVVEERNTLDKRIASLHAFINSETFPTVDRAERNRLIRQEAIMIELSQVLAERIAAFHAASLPAANSGGADLGIQSDDFQLGKACDLSGEGTCEACQ
jgi:hypothetical protein